MTEQEEAFTALVESFREKRVFLMVGAGSSMKVGMPSWSELLDILNENLEEKIDKSETISDSQSSKKQMEFAEKIKEQYRRESRLDDYFSTIKSTFSRKITPLPFHESLVNVGWHGITTTNYDLILEETLNSIHNRQYNSAFEPFSSTRRELSMEDVTYLCQPLDLCNQQPDGGILNYCRSFSSKLVRSVVHLHGCVNYPQGIILTNSDYKKAYNEGFHSEVLKALIYHSVIVFVGFSMDDEFFMGILEQINRHFKGETLGYAFLSREADGAPEDNCLQIERYGLQPICFNVKKDSNGAGSGDYSELDALIFELKKRIDTLNKRNDDTKDRKRRYPSIDDISRRMME